MPGTRIQWDRIDEKTFNDLVEALLVREHTGDGLIAMAVDGRGGDGGIDVDVRVESTDQLVNIFQLKFFPEGFSKGFVGRREQIKRGMIGAMELVRAGMTAADVRAAYQVAVATAAMGQPRFAQYTDNWCYQR